MALFSSIRRYLKNRDGSTAIEAALCIPLVLLMIFACIQYSIFFFNSSNMHRTMDENMRQATILDLPTKDQIEQLIQDTLSADIAQDVNYSVTLVDEFDQIFAQVNLTYTRSMDLPFFDEFELQSNYSNYMLLSASQANPDSGDANG